MLKISQRNSSEYGGPVQALIRKSGSPVVINVHRVGESIKYLTGTYDVEVLTLPPVHRRIEISHNQVTPVEIPAPGLVNINTNVPGHGSIFELNSDGTQSWLLNLNRDTRKAMGMQPGQYKLVFRAENAKGSKFTEIYDFEIKSGATKNINLFGQ
jgi:Ca-activated chloride channel family protein